MGRTPHLNSRFWLCITLVCTLSMLMLATPDLAQAASNLGKNANTSTGRASQSDSIINLIEGFFADLDHQRLEFEKLERPYPAHPWDTWGLGWIEREYVSNDPGYDWYINQNNTGKYGFENCGPASVTMAAEWADPYFRHKTEDARATYHPNGGWWYMENIADYLDLYGIPNEEKDNTGDEAMKKELRSGNIMIINIDLRALTYNPDPTKRVDKFYSGGTGHFIVIKGFVQVDQTLFYECYDPATQTFYYPDGQPKGKDRYYRASEIQNAMLTWYDSYLVVKPKYP